MGKNVHGIFLPKPITVHWGLLPSKQKSGDREKKKTTSAVSGLKNPLDCFVYALSSPDATVPSEDFPTKLGC